MPTARGMAQSAPRIAPRPWSRTTTLAVKIASDSAPATTRSDPNAVSRVRPTATTTYDTTTAVGTSRNAAASTPGASTYSSSGTHHSPARARNRAIDVHSQYRVGGPPAIARVVEI